MAGGEYRRRPDQITAIRFDGTNDAELAEFMGVTPDIRTGVSGNRWVALTLANGDEAFAQNGDWIIPETSEPGRFYPCKPEAFAVLYEVNPGA